MTMHVEVDSKSKFAEIHDVIDDIEHNVLTLFNVNLTIHMDPIDLNNPISDNYKEKVINYLKELSNELSIHDFRMIKKKKFITLIFDIVVPYDFYLPNLEITKYLSSKFNESEIIELKINYDQNYIE